MSNAEASAESWPVLSIFDRRVLGVLIEKQKTSKSPDAYPMSVNAITTGCNQKSNRDPVLDLEEDEVEDTLTRLQGGGWVSKITGGRVERWRHLLYENWKVGRVELAILAELLLRGPQSEGDLRTRVCRMDDVPDLDQLRALLKPLAERKLVVYLTPPERRGATLTHGFHSPAELQSAAAAIGRVVVETVSAEGRSSLAEDVERLRAEVRELREWVLELRAARQP
jgi:uncharacterized protein